MPRFDCFAFATIFDITLCITVNNPTPDERDFLHHLAADLTEATTDMPKVQVGYNIHPRRVGRGERHCLTLVWDTSFQYTVTRVRRTQMKRLARRLFRTKTLTWECRYSDDQTTPIVVSQEDFVKIIMENAHITREENYVHIEASRKLYATHARRAARAAALSA